MTSDDDLGTIARAIIDANLYMTLGTADESGRPWVSPVYYATDDRSEFFWVSWPDSTHSRNVVARPQISAVIFDSHVPIGTGQAVYIAAEVDQPAGTEVERGIDVFSRASLRHGGRAWTVDEVGPQALHRLYRAAASAHWVLDPAGHPDHPGRLDYRTRVQV